MNLSEIQKLVFEEYKKNGYLDLMNSPPKKFRWLSDLAEVGLFDTETTEAKERIRDGDCGEVLGFELADLVIRVLNFASRKSIDIEKCVIKKHGINCNRGKLHGRKIL